MSAVEFPIDKIIVGKRLRAADVALVETYRLHILEREARGQRGLIEPIQLSEAKGKKGHAELVNGLHRLLAYRALGRDTIPADVHPAMSPVERQIAEIDAQIMHAGLTPLDKAEFLARRKSLYEDVYPETRAHVAGGKARQARDAAASDILSFAPATAARLGVERRTVERLIFISERLTPQARELVESTPASLKVSEMLALAKLEPKLQLKVARRIADPDAPEKSIGAARAWAEGAVAPTASQRSYNGAVAAWQKMSARERGQFLTFLQGEDLPKGWTVRKAG